MIDNNVWCFNIADEFCNTMFCPLCDVLADKFFQSWIYPFRTDWNTLQFQKCTRTKFIGFCKGINNSTDQKNCRKNDGENTKKRFSCAALVYSKHETDIAHGYMPRSKSFAFYRIDLTVGTAAVFDISSKAFEYLNDSSVHSSWWDDIESRGKIHSSYEIRKFPSNSWISHQKHMKISSKSLDH